MEAALMRALELDDTLVEVHNGLAAFKWVYQRDWIGAEREFKRGIALNPKFAAIHSHYSIYLTVMGRFDEAIAEGRRALDLDPLSPRFHRNQAARFYYARRCDEAIKHYHEALELEPDDSSLHEELGDAYEQKQMFGAAITEWHKSLTLARDEELSAILGETYAEEGFVGAVQAVAQKRLERLSGRVKRGEYVPAAFLARACLKLGDKEQTFWWLQKACGELNVFGLMINSDPFYDSLRADSRFGALLEGLNLV
jgi:tetratricopeptide (TPR) repeat protein